MRNQFPPSDKCDFHDDRLAVFQSDDGADLCEECKNECVEECAGCGETMVWSTSICYTVSGIPYCQLCDGELEEMITHKREED